MLRLMTPDESPAITAALIMLVLSLAILVIFGLYVWRQAHQPQRAATRPLDQATQPIAAQAVAAQPIAAQPVAEQPVAISQPARPATVGRSTVSRPVTAARRPARGTARVLAH
jgi:hypothetical protein